MDKDTYELIIIMKDCTGKYTYSKEINEDTPLIIDFANFCHEAARAFGYSELQVDKLLPFHWDFDED